MTFDTADILGSESADGELRLKLGDAVTGVGISADSATWGTDGFAARPNDPETGAAARALYMVDGNEKVAIGTKDNRYVSKVGQMQPGDRMIYGKGEQRVLVKEATASVTLYSKNAKTGSSMMATVVGSEGVVQVRNGNASMEMKDDRIQLAVVGPGGQVGSLIIDSTGVTINGATFKCQTGGGSLGTLGPAPLVPVVNSIVMGPTGMAGVGSSKWLVAP